MWIFKVKYQAKRENIKCLMIIKSINATKTLSVLKWIQIDWKTIREQCLMNILFNCLFLFSCENLPITKCVEKPQGFDKLIIMAKILGNDLNYVRVDLYNVNSKIYAGELTFTPAGRASKFYPNE